MSSSFTRRSITIRNVLIPIDGSAQSKYAFEWYMNNLKRENDMVIFIHVIEPIVSSPLSGLSDTSSQIETGDNCHVTQESLHHGRLLCQELIHESSQRGIKSRAFLVVDNRPGRALLKSVGEEKIDVVVMANRGLGKLKSAFLGSTSAYMLHQAQVPMAIIPPVRKSSI